MKFSILNRWESKLTRIRMFWRIIWTLHSACRPHIALIKTCKCFWNSFNRLKCVSWGNLIRDLLFKLFRVLIWNLSRHFECYFLLCNLFLCRIMDFNLRFYKGSHFTISSINFGFYVRIWRSLSWIFSLLTISNQIFLLFESNSSSLNRFQLFSLLVLYHCCRNSTLRSCSSRCSHRLRTLHRSFINYLNSLIFDYLLFELLDLIQTL